MLSSAAMCIFTSTLPSRSKAELQPDVSELELDESLRVFVLDFFVTFFIDIGDDILTTRQLEAIEELWLLLLMELGLVVTPKTFVDLHFDKIFSIMSIFVKTLLLLF